MRMCLKCSKKVSDDSKICRDCGAILEDIPDDSVPGTGSESKPESQLRSPWTAKPWKSRHEESDEQQEECDEQAVGEQIAKLDKPIQADTEASAWKCPQCGESVPGTFDVCWKCSTTRDGEKVEESESEFFQEDPDASTPNEESEPTEDEPTEDDAEDWGMERDIGQPQSVCPRCGSSQMMFGVTVQDQGQHSSGQLRVVICGDPSALIFKDRLYGELKANLCGECGHVELRVTNARELYRHYRKST